MVTRVPYLTDLPGSGDCLTTVPEGFDELLSCCSVTWKPLLRSRFSADVCDCPLTSGTLTIFGPLETISFTRVLGATTFPFCLLDRQAVHWRHRVAGITATQDGVGHTTDDRQHDRGASDPQPHGQPPP